MDIVMLSEEGRNGEKEKISFTSMHINSVKSHKTLTALNWGKRD